MEEESSLSNMSETPKEQVGHSLAANQKDKYLSNFSSTRKKANFKMVRGEFHGVKETTKWNMPLPSLEDHTKDNDLHVRYEVVGSTAHSRRKNDFDGFC